MEARPQTQFQRQTACIVQVEPSAVSSSLGPLLLSVANEVFNLEPCWRLSEVHFKAVLLLWRK